VFDPGGHPFIYDKRKCSATDSFAHSGWYVHRYELTQATRPIIIAAPPPSTIVRNIDATPPHSFDKNTTPPPPAEDHPFLLLTNSRHADTTPQQVFQDISTAAATSETPKL